MNVPIVYEDNHLLIVEKPVNVPVQKDESKDEDLLTMLKEDIKRRYEKPGNVYLALLHRLDRPVGGAIVFAKTSKAASRMSDLLRRRELVRRYLAVVHGRPPKKSGLVEHYLWKDKRENKVYVVPPTRKGAKRALLEYDVLQSSEKFSLLSVKLHTGRSHQIRVQLAALGCPLYGDQKYGQSQNKVGQQLALWSHQLQFIHPVRKEAFDIRSYPPNEYPWNDFGRIRS